jgi:hypothetical protein
MENGCGAKTRKKLFVKVTKAIEVARNSPSRNLYRLGKAPMVSRQPMKLRIEPDSSPANGDEMEGVVVSIPTFIEYFDRDCITGSPVNSSPRRIGV